MIKIIDKLIENLFIDMDALWESGDEVCVEDAIKRLKSFIINAKENNKLN